LAKLLKLLAHVSFTEKRWQTCSILLRFNVLRTGKDGGAGWQRIFGCALAVWKALCVAAAETYVPPACTCHCTTLSAVPVM
jgi:hypothetical protein